MRPYADAAIDRAITAARGSAIWRELHGSIAAAMEDNQPQLRPRLATMNIPLASAGSAPAIANPVLSADPLEYMASAVWITSAGISFNARVVGYQIFALAPGQLAIDIQRSSPDTHDPAFALATDPTLQFPSIIGDASLLPALSGVYAENLAVLGDGVTPGWLAPDLSAGDMLHFYAVMSDGLARSCTMILYLQDLDAKTWQDT